MIIDVNVFEDVIRKRMGWVESKKILHLVENGQINGWISSLTKAILYFLCVKRVGEEKSRNLVDRITVGFSEIPLRHEINDRAIHCGLPKYEDNIQFESAKQFHLDGIITRNKKHYKQSEVPVYTPEEFITMFYQENKPIENTPFLDLKAQHHQVYNEIDDRITDIIY